MLAVPPLQDLHRLQRYCTYCERKGVEIVDLMRF